MNSVLRFIETHRERLGLGRYGAEGELSYVLLTPRFHVSSHVIFLVSHKGDPNPVLVGKIPRLTGVSQPLEREVANLRAVQSLRPGGFDSIPRVIAFEVCGDRPLLIETALVGPPIDPPTVRRDPAACCHAVAVWLTDLQEAQCSPTEEPGWFERLIEGPFNYLLDFFLVSSEAEKLLSKTLEILLPLRRMNPPLVFEHGDLASPNVLLLKAGGVGVLDWELAEPRGLPACDLIFFLTYAAFAVGRAQRDPEFLLAFQKAFFGHEAWAHQYVWDSMHALGVSPSLLTPLLVACWMRYVAKLLLRLKGSPPLQRQDNAATAKWLRASRYFALWQYAVEHEDELIWERRSQAG